MTASIVFLTALGWAGDLDALPVTIVIPAYCAPGTSVTAAITMWRRSASAVRGRANAEGLRSALFKAAANGHDTLVTDMTQTQVYGEGDQAERAAYAKFKRTFEKRGDHWIQKQPSPPERG